MDTVDIWKHKSKNVKHKKIICSRAYYLFVSVPIITEMGVFNERGNF